MGLFDAFRKKPSIGNRIGALCETHKNAAPFLMCYRMAYETIPTALENGIDQILSRITSDETAGFFFYTRACLDSGSTPEQELLDAFPIHVASLPSGNSYYVFEYLRPPNPLARNPQTGIPIPAPYFSAIVRGSDGSLLGYFVLGQSMTGGTAMRAVAPNGRSVHLDFGCEPTLEAFIDCLEKNG